MTKQEFFDKIDSIREIAKHNSCRVAPDSSIITTIRELRDNAELLLDEEYQIGYETGWKEGRNYIENE